MAPTFPNPNWPTLFAEGNFGANPYYLPNALLVYTDLTPRLYRQWSIRRGKQFELDQVQPGEFHGQWVNTDGALDPANTTSYYTPGVLPYRGFRVRTQYPSSVNILGGDQATGGEVTPLATGTTGTAYGVNTAASGMASFVVTASGSAFQGTQVWQATGTSSVSNTIFYTNNVPIQAVLGTTYTFSINVRSVTTGANPQVNLGVVWVNPGGNAVSQTSGSTVTLTGSPTASWTQLTYTASVPGPSSGIYPVAAQWFIQLAASPAGTWSFQADGLQAELNSSASTFSIPGKGYPVYSGMIERYPQSWDYTGTYGLVSPVCVDTMALLSQAILKEAFVMDVAATQPQWFFPLNDASGSTTFQEQAGRTSAAGLFSSSQGAGTLTAGSAIASATPVTGKFYGTNGPVVTVSNPTPNQGTVVDLTQAGSTSPPTTGGWSRMLAFRTATTVGAPIMAAVTNGYNPGAVPLYATWYLSIQGGASMNVAVSMYNDAGTNASVVNSAVVNDNNWHMAVFTLSADGLTLTLYVDGVAATSVSGTDMHFTLSANDGVGGDEYKFAGLVSNGAASWQGDIALYAQWNSVLNGTTVTNLYNSFKTAYQGERSDQRYNRILGWAGYQGAFSLDSGNTTSMGYANDINGSDALTALSNVVNTEGGRHYVNVSGAVVFQNRQRFFQAVTPVWTFGENQGSGEIPYTNLAFDFDPTRVSNAISVTQVSSGQVYFANDTTSQQAYGVRSFSRSNQSTVGEEVREQAFFYLSRYKDPHMRIQLLTIDAAANPALWTSVLAFEIGQFVKINRRDQFGVRPTISMFGFIEQITHTGDDKGAWKVELQISPGGSTATGTSYATFTSLRTTLFSNATGGTNTITISPLPDSATNPVRSELTGGQILTITGGGNSESVTIATGGVQNQAAGYASAVLTLTSNLLHSYSSGATVVEATGANYDTLAAFDQVQFSY